MLRKLEVPILTVSRATRPLKFERILFATDLSESSTSASRFILDFAHVANSKLTVLHAVEKGGLKEGGAPMGAYISPRHINEARAKLDELRRIQRMLKENETTLFEKWNARSGS